MGSDFTINKQGTIGPPWRNEVFQLAPQQEMPVAAAGGVRMESWALREGTFQGAKLTVFRGCGHSRLPPCASSGVPTSESSGPPTVQDFSSEA